jgi:ATP-dependent Clp protease protease subunit
MAKWTRKKIKLAALLILCMTVVPDLATVGINGTVDGYSSSIVRLQLRVLDAVLPKDKPIRIYLRSPGGYVLDGMDILNTINNLQNNGRKIEAVVTSYCASMCFSILQAADVRLTYPYAIFMQHPVWPPGGGASAMERLLRLPEAIRMGMDPALWALMTKQDQWFTSLEAIRLNIVDDVISE